MGAGLTLTSASHAVIFEQAWRPADHDQTEDRLHRIGQESAVNVYYLLNDRNIAELIDGKREKVARATGDTQSAQRPIDTFDIARRPGDGQTTAAADRAAPRVDPEVDDADGDDVPAPAASDGS